MNTNGLRPASFAAQLVAAAAAIAAALITATANAQPAPGSFKDCDQCPEMIPIPAGSYFMGSEFEPERAATEKSRRASYTYSWGDVGPIIDRVSVMPWQTETPKHEVQIKAIAVSKYEITRSQFARFMATGWSEKPRSKSEAKGCRVVTDSGRTEWRFAASWQAPGFAQTDLDPVVCVSWDDAKEFVDWLSRTTGQRYRLLTEAEWEYAARSGNQTRYWWQGGPNDHCAFANGADATARGKFQRWTVKNNLSSTCADGQVFTAPVGSYAPNPFGLYDVSGNAAEWTEDCYMTSYAGAPTDGRAVHGGPQCSSNVTRGGSWADEPAQLSSSYRAFQDSRQSWVGLRVARDL